MLTDALLAWLHYQAIFLLIVALTAEAVLLRPDIQSPAISRLLNYDRVYLTSAILVVITGGLRLAFGVKGLAFYMSNPWFHAKIAVFIAIGLCSIPPTLSFLNWKKTANLHPGLLPDNAAIKRARRWVMLEAHLIILLPLFAALMARGVGL